MLNIITNGYILPFISKPNLVRAPLIRSGYKALQKRTSSDLLYPVASVKEHNRKGGKCKISWVLQSPVSCTQASPKVEARNRPKQAQQVPACRKVQNGNTRVHQGLSDSRGMGVIDRPIRCLPSHPHQRKLKEVPKVLPQVTSVSVHFPSLRPSHGPPGLYNDCKRGEADGPVKGNVPETISAHLEWWQDPTNVMKGADLHPKDHSIQLFTDASNEGWGAHLEQTSAKGLWSDREKRLHINILELKAVSLALQKVQGPVSKPNSASCNGQLNSGSLHKQTRRNSISRDVCSPVEDHDLVPSLPDNIKSQTPSRVSECDGRPSVQVEPSPVNRMVTASSGVQTDLSQVVHSSCRSFCHSPEPQSSTIRVSSPRPKCLGHRCSEHKLEGSHCLCLPSHSSPSQGDQKSQAIQLLDHGNSPRLTRMPWFWDLVQLSTEIPLQLPVSRTLLKQSHNYVFHSNPQHLNLHAWCLGVDSSKNKASLWRWQGELLSFRDCQQGPSTSQSGPYWKNGAEKIRWISPLPL